MSDSGAVYQPTTVGYTYDTGGDGTGNTNRLRHGFLRIMSRHKISSRKWREWVLFSVALCFFAAGLITMFINLFSSDDTTQTKIVHEIVKQEGQMTTMPMETNENESQSKSSIALGAGVMLIGLMLGFVWVWIRFFRRSKSPRGGLSVNNGQMLGGLNPSTDLLVGSTSQYGPVLTELPCQLKMKQGSSLESPAVHLSDQEEETRTLMQDSMVPSTITINPNLENNQISG